jgi:hypothetical protein
VDGERERVEGGSTGWGCWVSERGEDGEEGRRGNRCSFFFDS